ncbi:hypothetical protein BACCIP111899_03773 [Bacillus rhizoplanae]|uniref:Uncharacterized protein n=1 Tax=Bacillus rhizoplanae TaxID=2880966 RepID=A0ABM8YFC5_9BACI|nr:hypothetical protein BACCIP111899_03773 [Bacillus rhizoplanae]
MLVYVLVHTNHQLSATGKQSLLFFLSSRLLFYYRSAYMQKIPTDSISRDDYYRGTTLVVDKIVYLSFLLTIILTVFPFIKTPLPLLRKRCSRIVIHVYLCTDFHQPSALYNREINTTLFPSMLYFY